MELALFVRRNFDKLLLKVRPLYLSFFAWHGTTENSISQFSYRDMSYCSGRRRDFVVDLCRQSRNLRSVSILRNAICAKLHSCPTIHNLSHYCGIRQISFSIRFTLLYRNSDTIEHVLIVINGKDNKMISRHKIIKEMQKYISLLFIFF